LVKLATIGAFMKVFLKMDRLTDWELYSLGKNISLMGTFRRVGLMVKLQLSTRKSIYEFINNKF
jgi:hypothetical protein